MVDGLGFGMQSSGLGARDLGSRSSFSLAGLRPSWAIRGPWHETLTPEPLIPFNLRVPKNPRFKMRLGVDRGLLGLATVFGGFGVRTCIRVLVVQRVWRVMAADNRVLLFKVLIWH